MISILDFGLGNLKSIQNGFLYLGHKTIITRDKKMIQDSDSLILPGVGRGRIKGTPQKLIKRI